jgi:hypothetical protein
MNAFYLFLYRWSRSHLRTRKGTKMICAECGLPVRKNDHYRVLEVKHVDCADAKLTGQMRLPEPLRSVVMKETA